MPCKSQIHLWTKYDPGTAAYAAALQSQPNSTSCKAYTPSETHQHHIVYVVYDTPSCQYRGGNTSGAKNTDYAGVRLLI